MSIRRSAWHPAGDPPACAPLQASEDGAGVAKGAPCISRRFETHDFRAIRRRRAPAAARPQAQTEKLHLTDIGD